MPASLQLNTAGEKNVTMTIWSYIRDPYLKRPRGEPSVNSEGRNIWNGTWIMSIIYVCYFPGNSIQAERTTRIEAWRSVQTFWIQLGERNMWFAVQWPQGWRNGRGCQGLDPSQFYRPKWGHWRFLTWHKEDLEVFKQRSVGVLISYWYITNSPPQTWCLHTKTSFSLRDLSCGQGLVESAHLCTIWCR